ncbi:glycosyltransferase [Bacillus cereus group sp. BfR-BA-01446]|uniref:tetratricopeptide repeat-containing glycosyltransferase family 2 protein n=1 Tax=Bacillus cereus group TaxID=86661 RepID=UPI0009762A98|nr:glycosyltransferase [Bacillus cereus group sp. BfR-BA-01446]
MTPFISACLIVKNEEDMIQKCLESLQNVVGEIVVVDTGSMDKTKEIAKRFTNKIYDFEWINDFAAARNFATSKAKGEWIIAIDADERIDSEGFIEALEEIKGHNNQYDTYTVEILSFVGKNGEGTVVNKMGRLYKNDGTISFEGAIHEQLKKCGKEPNISDSPITLYHYGYLKHVVEKQDKKNRNLKIIKKTLEIESDRGFAHFNYGQELRGRGETKKALEYFVKAYQYKESIKTEWVRKCLYFIVECLVELSQYEEALDIIRNAEAVWSLAPDLICWKGDIYFLQNRYNDAKSVYESILKDKNLYEGVIFDLERKSFIPNKRLGQIYEMEKNEKKALLHYVEAFNKNQLSISTVAKIADILSRYHDSREVYEFLSTRDMIKTDEVRLGVIKNLLIMKETELSLLLTRDLEDENQTLIPSLELKAKMIKQSEVVIDFVTDDILVGIQSGILDLADLCVLYEITKDESVRKIVEHSNFSHVFAFLFEGVNRSVKLKEKEFLVVLDKALRYNKPEFAEKLIGFKNYINKGIDAKIGDLFYENGYKDIALDFYQLVHETYVTRQGYLNIIDWLTEYKNVEEAQRIVLQAINRFNDDFRLYKIAIELLKNQNSDIVAKALKRFPDSKWLKDQETNSI